jgi:cell division transport system permease protein
MTTLRQYITLFFPILTILISLHIYSYISKLTNQYLDSVNQQYSIVIVSKNKISENKIKKSIDNVLSLNLISTKKSLKQFKDILSDKNFASLSLSIPYFYQLKLSSFPTKRELLDIKHTLKKHKSIIKIETFIKKYSSFNIMLENTNKIVTFFSIIVIMLSSMLISKLTKLWYFEHKNRMDVMELFGASLMQRSFVLFKISIINSIVSSGIVVALFYYINSTKYTINLLSQMGLINIQFNILSEFILSLCVSLSISLIILLFMIIKHK